MMPIDITFIRKTLQDAIMHLDQESDIVKRLKTCSDMLGPAYDELRKTALKYLGLCR